MSRLLNCALLGFFLFAPGKALSGAGKASQEFQIITLDDENRFLSLVRRLSEGADFAELARKHSLHPTAREGGYWEISADEAFLAELLRRFEEAADGAILYFPHPELHYVIVRRVDPMAKVRTEVREHLAAGNRLLNENKVGEAIALFKQALALDPRSGEAHLLLGYSYMKKADYNMIGEAKAEFQQTLAANPGLIWARYYLAKIYIDLGRLEDAEEQLRRMLESDSDIAHARALLGEVRRQLGEAEFSVEQNTRALALEPNLTAGHYYLALAYLDLNREPEALQQLELAAASEGAAAEVHVSLGRLYGKQERYDEAVGELERAIETQPGYADAHLELARVYRLQGRLGLAEKELARTMPEGRATPMSPYFQGIRSALHFETGRVHQQKGELSAARESYLNALAIRSDDGPTHRRLTEVLFALGEIEKAREHARRARELGSPVDEALLKKMDVQGNGAHERGKSRP